MYRVNVPLKLSHIPILVNFDYSDCYKRRSPFFSRAIKRAIAFPIPETLDFIAFSHFPLPNPQKHLPKTVKSFTMEGLVSLPNHISPKTPSPPKGRVFQCGCHLK
jgi:hypothetical protein